MSFSKDVKLQVYFL